VNDGQLQSTYILYSIEYLADFATVLELGLLSLGLCSGMCHQLVYGQPNHRSPNSQPEMTLTQASRHSGGRARYSTHNLGDC
jgi:hypothetical protein